MSATRLPLELLWEIVEYVDADEKDERRRRTLKALRRTCSALKGHTTPFLFRIIRTNDTLRGFSEQYYGLHSAGYMKHIQQLEVNVRSMWLPVGESDPRLAIPLTWLDNTWCMIDLCEAEDRVTRMRHRETCIMRFKMLLNSLLLDCGDSITSLTINGAEPSSPAEGMTEQPYSNLAISIWFFEAIGLVCKQVASDQRILQKLQNVHIISPTMIPNKNIWFRCKSLRFTQTHLQRIDSTIVSPSNDIELFPWVPLNLFPEPYRKICKRSSSRDLEYLELSFSPVCPPLNPTVIKVRQPGTFQSSYSLRTLGLEYVGFSDNKFIRIFECLPHIQKLSLRRIYLSFGRGTRWVDLFTTITACCPKLEEFHLACPRYGPGPYSAVQRGNPRHAPSIGWQPCDCGNVSDAYMPAPSEYAALRQLRGAVTKLRQREKLPVEGALESKCGRFSVVSHNIKGNLFMVHAV